MSKLKQQIRSNWTEFFLLLVSIAYCLATSIFNPIAWVLIAGLLYQFNTQKPVSGIVIASIVFFASFYMLLAMVSELSEFVVHDSKFYNLLIFGSLIFGSCLLAGFLMFKKYIRKQMYIENEMIISQE